jgi:hypothetical protein
MPPQGGRGFQYITANKVPQELFVYSQQFSVQPRTITNKEGVRSIVLPTLHSLFTFVVLSPESPVPGEAGDTPKFKTKRSMAVKFPEAFIILLK